MSNYPRQDPSTFKNHQFVEIKSEHAIIHKFYQPGTNCYGVTFINSCGILAVTGDLGNWIFCREFIPVPTKQGIDDHYWIQKLQISSEQRGRQFSNDLTRKAIIEAKSELSEVFEDKHEAVRYYDSCLWALDNMDDSQYQNHAYGELPSGWDFESVIYKEETIPQLEYVFDAFDAMCIKMKENENLPQ